MPRLTEKYRPSRLADIAGQDLTPVQAWLADPYPCCWLFEGPPGTGKTTAALAVAHELGVPNEWAGLHVEVSTELTIDRCRELFERTLRLRPMSGSGWKVLVIEELECLTSVQMGRYLKNKLEFLPPKTVVVATSNGAGAIEKALLQRFQLIRFCGGPGFGEDCQDRIAAVFRQETGGDELPFCWTAWGWCGGDEWSMRVALDDMQKWLNSRKIEGRVEHART